MITMRIFALFVICLSLLAFQEKPSAVIKGDLGNGRYSINAGKQNGLKETDKLNVLDNDKKPKALLVVKELGDDYAIVQLIEGSITNIAIGDVVEVKSAGGAQPEPPKPQEQKPPEHRHSRRLDHPHFFPSRFMVFSPRQSSSRLV